ncbi:ABC transporter substrate-binding protein [Candidatus Aerophobetes bacterium]|nr:ABC transporter substrate-binding protein [Candidatus Aerophobetes bacterium]
MFARKKIALVVALVGIVSFLVTGSLFAEEMVDISRYKKSPPYRVAFDIYYQGNTWGIQLLEEFKAEVARHPHLISEAFYTDSEGNTAKQISNIEDLIVRNPDILVLTPNSPTALVPVIEKAYDRGIAVILCAAGANTDKYTAFVNVDDFEYGVTGAKWLAETIGYKGNVVGLSGIAGLSTAEDRWMGVMSVLNKYPEIKVIAHEYCDWTYTKAKIAMESIVVAHPKIDGIWTGAGMMARGAIEALLAAGRKVPPITADDDNGYLKMWKQYNLTAFSSTKPAWLSQKGLQVGLDILQGKPTPKDTILPAYAITAENLDEFVRPDMPDSMFCNTHLPEDVIRRLYPGE